MNKKKKMKRLAKDSQPVMAKQPSHDEKAIPTNPQIVMEVTMKDKINKNVEKKDAEQDEQVARKSQCSINQKIATLRTLVKENDKSKEEICKEMSLTNAQFDKLYFLLSQEDKCFYPLTYRPPVRRTCVGKNGFSISMEKITLMGLNKIFTEGRELDFSCKDNKIIIEAVIAKFEDENDFDVLDVDRTDTLGEESTIMKDDDVPLGFSGEDCEELDTNSLMEMEEGE